MREVGRAEHASTEQLSALLDGRAEPDDQGFLAGHVDRCMICSDELADLRSVRDLLRALPVYLPPRSFTIPIEAARVAPRRFQVLIPLTRALGTVAAVLCVVLFSMDAMQTGYDAPVAAPNGGSAAMHITAATLETAEAAKPAEPRAAGRSAAESSQPADAASKIANAPAAPPAQPAPAQQAQGATAKPQAASAPAAPQPTSAAFAPPAPAPTAAPTIAAPTVVPAPVQRPQQPSAWLSPIRLWSLGFALIAAALLIGSLVLSRMSRTGSGPLDEWTRS